MTMTLERHDVRNHLRTRSLRRLLVPPFVASLATAVGVVVVFGDWRPLVWQSFVISLLYATSISVFARLVMPAGMRAVMPTVGRRVGLPGLPLAVGITVALLGAAAAGSLVVGALALALGLERRPGFWATYFQMARITAVLALASGFVTHFYERLTSELRDTKTQLREKELQEARATKQALEARLSSLESRVHPHFLFNTLNSLSALIPVDPARAEDMVDKLAALLRSSLNLTTQRTIALDDEMAIVRDYLSIEQQRLGPRLACTIAVPSDAVACLVPPFAVQGLVENAVKHGIAAQESGGRIEVAARRDAVTLHVEVRDSGPGFDLSQIPPGHGLDNLVARLDTTFGASAGLDVTRRDGWCVVALHVPVRHEEAGDR